MNILTLDTETFFSDDYTLKKLTTEAYVRDERFELLCTGIKKGKEAPAGAFLKAPLTLKPDAEDYGFVCHHAHFDGLILNHYLNIRPMFWFDTLSMARLVFPHEKSHSLGSLADKLGIGHKTVPYEEFKGKRLGDMSEDLKMSLLNGCAQDVELTSKIFYELLPMVPKEELRVIDLTVRMFTEPVLELDRARAKIYMDGLITKQEELLLRLGVSKTDLSSNDKFAQMLINMGIEPPVKTSPRTGKITYAFAKTDPDMQAMVEGSEGEQVELLCQARLSAKSTIGETRAQRLLSMSTRGALPVYLKYYGAHTGRWSGGDKLNFQNFPRGGELRKSLLAPKGYVLGVIDLSQIECRMLNFLAGEDWVLDAFKQGRDLYCEMATSIFGYTVTKAHKTERQIGKMLVLGAGYGIGWKKFKDSLKRVGVEISEGLAKQAINAYRNKHPKVVRAWAMGDMFLGRMHSGDKPFPYACGTIVSGKNIVLPNGAVLDYSNLDRTPEGYILDNPRGKTNIYGGKVIENLVQALARIVMSRAMVKLSKVYRIVTTTHDELVYLIPEEEADMGLEIGLEIMKEAPRWCFGLPLDAEGGYAREYSK